MYLARLHVSLTSGTSGITIISSGGDARATEISPADHALSRVQQDFLAYVAS